MFLPEPFEFLQNVLTEVMELFPGPFIHIGGDEPFAWSVRDREAPASAGEGAAILRPSAPNPARAGRPRSGVSR